MAVMNSSIEKKLWDAADALRTNSKLKSSEYATPVLGLIFLRFADYRFSIAEKCVEKEFENSRRAPSKIDYQRQGVLYTPPTARYNYLLNLPEEEDIQLSVIQAMKDIEEENPSLKDVHGLEGDIKECNTYYQNIHGCYHRMNYIMANPPFNAKGVDKERVKGDKRYPFGIPINDNTNYLWIQEFYSEMKLDEGKAGFVMANSATDARGTELEIRKQIIESEAVDVMISIGSNFFYTVTLPCTLWFFDNHKTNHDRKDTVLFIDARNIFTQTDRAHREFSEQQLEYLANIVRMYHNKDVENHFDSDELLKEQFAEGKYQDIPGLCKVASISDIEAQGWSLNPGRYVGTAVEEFDEEDFALYFRVKEYLQKNMQSMEFHFTVQKKLFRRGISR